MGKAAVSRLALSVVALVLVVGCGSGGGSSKIVGTGTTGPGATGGLAFVTTGLPMATVAQTYVTTLSATNGTRPYLYRVVAGALPSGLSFDGSGVIAGVPTAAGTSTLAIEVSDALNATALASFNLVVQAASGGGGGGGGSATTGTWTDLQSPRLPSALAAAAAASDGTAIYIFGGLNNGTSPSNAIYKYDPTAGSLQRLSATLPRPLAYLEAVTVGTGIYILGGSDSSNVYSSVSYFSPAAGTITQATSMPEGRDSVAAAAVGNTLYVFGGTDLDLFGSFSAISTTTIWKGVINSTSSITWSSVGSLSSPLQWGKALAHNNKVYLIGGGNFEVNLLSSSQTTLANYSSTQVFDPTTNQLSQTTSLPVATKALVGGVIGNKLFVCSGDRTNGVHTNSALWCQLSDDTYSFDTTSNTWSTLAEFQTDIPGRGIFGGRALAAGATLGGKLYLIGGYTLPTPGTTAPPCPTTQGAVDGIAVFTP